MYNQIKVFYSPKWTMDDDFNLFLAWFFYSIERKKTQFMWIKNYFLRHAERTTALPLRWWKTFHDRKLFINNVQRREFCLFFLAFCCVFLWHGNPMAKLLIDDHIVIGIWKKKCSFLMRKNNIYKLCEISVWSILHQLYEAAVTMILVSHSSTEYPIFTCLKFVSFRSPSAQSFRQQMKWNYVFIKYGTK